MQFGLPLNSQHPAPENMRDRLQEILQQVRLAQAVGFHSIGAPQHYLPAPFQMLQPLTLLARMAAEAQQMRLIAGIMLLSLQNPIALAEDIGTLDAICNGQFTLGGNPSPRKSPSVESCSSLRIGFAHLHAVSGAEIPDLCLLGSVRGIVARRHARSAIRRVAGSAVHHRQPR